MSVFASIPIYRVPPSGLRGALPAKLDTQRIDGDCRRVDVGIASMAPPYTAMAPLIFSGFRRVRAGQLPRENGMTSYTVGSLSSISSGNRSAARPGGYPEPG